MKLEMCATGTGEDDGSLGQDDDRRSAEGDGSHGDIASPS